MTENEDDEKTTEERLAWLRDRGVQISTPEERRAGRVVNAMKEADGLPGEGDEISYVLVPSDTSRPFQEFTVTRPFTASGDILVDYLKPVFANKSGEVDVTLLQREASNTILGSSNAPAKVSDEALRKVASEASVETFTLVRPVPSNKFTGINIYLDEVGMLKRLPLNTRASKFAERAGFSPPPQFYGDVFLGRVAKDSSNKLRNVSFVLGIDTAADAPWLLAAATENLEYQMEINSITGRKDTRQAAVAGSDGKSKKEDGYAWSQTEQELEVTVTLPTAEKKDLQVKFKPLSVHVTHQKTTLLDLQLFERIDVDSATWTIDSGVSPPQLVITMEKSEEALWPRIQD